MPPLAHYCLLLVCIKQAFFERSVRVWVYLQSACMKMMIRAVSARSNTPPPCFDLDTVCDSHRFCSSGRWVHVGHTTLRNSP